MALRKTAMLVAILTLALAACGGGAESTVDVELVPGNPVAGESIYSSTCAACHGADLQGIDGLGKGLAPNDFVAANSEEELAAFIAVGRSADDPDNMTGVDMPPKGGNPSLTEQDLLDVSAYLKAQQ